MRTVILFLFSLFPWMVVAQQSPSEEFINQLSPVVKNLVQILQDQGPYIGQLERAKKSGDAKALRSVTASGLLLKALIDSEDKYFALDVDQLQKANRFLLQIDTDISKGTGYGNLLLKSQIVEMILESTHRLLMKEKKDSAYLESISKTLDMLRYHLPDRLAAKYIFTQAFGLPANVRNINANPQSLAEENSGSQDIVREMRAKHLNAKMEAGILQMQRTHKNAANLYSLYEKPGNLQLSYAAESYSNSWMILKVYCVTLIKKGADFNDWKSLGDEWYQQVLGVNDPWVKYLNIGMYDMESYISRRNYRFQGPECYRYKKCE